MAQLTALVIAMLGGILIGFVLPSFIQMYRISQMAYGKGFEHGKYTVGALVRRARRALECPHGRPRAGAPGVVCISCANEARKQLELIDASSLDV